MSDQYKHFLNNARDFAESLVADIQYWRFDAVLATLAMTKSTCTVNRLERLLDVSTTTMLAMMRRRMREDRYNQLPLSTCLIVNKGTGMSSAGFFEQARDLGVWIGDGDERQFWEQCRDACYENGAVTLPGEW